LVDSYDGKVSPVRDALQMQPGDVFSLGSFHCITAKPSAARRIIVLVAGWVPAILYVSGIVIWRRTAADKHAQIG
jgi:hypothetical protein